MTELNKIVSYLIDIVYVYSKDIKFQLIKEIANSLCEEKTVKEKFDDTIIKIKFCIHLSTIYYEKIKFNKKEIVQLNKFGEDIIEDLKVISPKLYYDITEKYEFEDPNLTDYLEVAKEFVENLEQYLGD